MSTPPSPGTPKSWLRNVKLEDDFELGGSEQHSQGDEQNVRRLRAVRRRMSAPPTMANEETAMLAAAVRAKPRAPKQSNQRRNPTLYVSRCQRKYQNHY